MRLAATGVERYQVDLTAFKKSTYGADGGFHFTDFPFENPAGVAETFDAAAIKQAILSSQQQKIDYQNFLKQIMQAGCCHYEVYITGRKAIYAGRGGSQHIELFPSAK